MRIFMDGSIRHACDIDPSTIFGDSDIVRPVGRCQGGRGLAFAADGAIVSP